MSYQKFKIEKAYLNCIEYFPLLVPLIAFIVPQLWSKCLLTYCFQENICLTDLMHLDGIYYSKGFLSYKIDGIIFN